jgi:hypothetical protein
VAGCCESGDEPSGSCATELVSLWWNVTLPTTKSSLVSRVFCHNFYSFTYFYLPLISFDVKGE